MNKIYIIYDTVANEELAVSMANNDRALIRTLAMTKFFNFNRLTDIEIYDTGLVIKSNVGEVKNEADLPRKVEVEEVLKSLAIEMTEKAEEKSPEDMKKKIKKTEEEHK